MLTANVSGRVCVLLGSGFRKTVNVMACHWVSISPLRAAMHFAKSTSFSSLPAMWAREGNILIPLSFAFCQDSGVSPALQLEDSAASSVGCWFFIQQRRSLSGIWSHYIFVVMVMWEGGSAGAGGAILPDAQGDVPSLPQVSSSLTKVQATFA